MAEHRSCTKISASGTEFFVITWYYCVEAQLEEFDNNCLCYYFQISVYSVINTRPLGRHTNGDDEIVYFQRVITQTCAALFGAGLTPFCPELSRLCCPGALR